MIRRSRTFRPSLNRLEERVVMSASVAPDVTTMTEGAPEVTTLSAIAPEVTTTSAGAPEVTTLSAARPKFVTSGTLTGKYLATGEDLRAADAPYEVGLNGGGSVRGLGKVTMTGSLRFGGFGLPNTPDVSGRVTLTNAQGSVTIELSGSGGSRSIPNARFGLRASIVSGTGAYSEARALGSANAVFGKNVIRSVTTPSPIGGSLTLQLNLKPPIR